MYLVACVRVCLAGSSTEYRHQLESSFSSKHGHYFLYCFIEQLLYVLRQYVVQFGQFLIAQVLACRHLCRLTATAAAQKQRQELA